MSERQPFTRPDERLSYQWHGDPDDDCICEVDGISAHCEAMGDRLDSLRSQPTPAGQ